MGFIGKAPDVLNTMSYALDVLQTQATNKPHKSHADKESITLCELS